MGIALRRVGGLFSRGMGIPGLRGKAAPALARGVP